VAVEEFHEQRAALFVADHHGSGTTLLIHGPNEPMGIGFGYESASMHCRLGYLQARRVGRGLRNDLDTRQDIAAMAGPRGSLASNRVAIP
jgi:2-phospho-L-lactate guanylyltransferase